ncbi:MULTISPECIES: hypothetical protein [unclassified Bacillus cereus group]|uniref:hypothetical protein n=1 Tax=unclassified Bacillus cereus group TaxID=2750818 RepID=UPI0022E6B074|nr:MULTISPECIES: hypothetical protein [unclassified Bacillus cereus group]MDA2143482.1 hypothetical protein [Bacillus cereus group sp. Bc248]MDA2171417.1 hypothetical protein [Bacillus cereus group sp. Bc247]
MVLIINIITLSLLSIIFVAILKRFNKNAYFDISILYTFTILIAPIIFFIVNVVSLYIIHSEKIYLSAIPLFIPCISVIYTRVQDYLGHKTYKRFKAFSDELIKIANNDGISINEKDIRIRIKKHNDVSIIFNVYSSKEEQKINGLRDEFQKCLDGSFENYNIEILIDKKKASNGKYSDLVYN